MTTKKIPKHAETSFASLCALYGATCNPATEDDRGWDYFVQFAARSNANQMPTPSDMLPEASKCLVQIKSVKGKPTGIRLKLSNAREFAKSTTPCFIVLIPYQNGIQADSVYVLHFWKNEIARTLKEMRELDSKGRSDLHRVRIAFPLADMTEVATAALLGLLESTIDREGTNYTKVKHSYSETVGFEDGHWTGSMSFQAPMDEIVDMTLGLKDTLQASAISVRSVRFGIKAGTALIDNVPGRVSLRSNPKQCLVLISSEPGGSEVSLSAELFYPAIPGLEKDQVRYRVVHPHLEMICSHGKGMAQFQGKYDGDERESLDEIATLFDLLHVFAAPRLHFRLSIDGKRLLGGTGQIEPRPLSGSVECAADFVKFLKSRTKVYEIPSGLRLSVNDLLASIDSVVECITFATEESVTGNASFDLTSEVGPFIGKALFAPCVEIPGFSIYVIVKRRIQMKPAGVGAVGFELGSIDYARVRILVGSMATTEHIIAQELEVCMREVVDEPVIIFPRRPRESPLSVTKA